MAKISASENAESSLSTAATMASRKFVGLAASSGSAAMRSLVARTIAPTSRSRASSARSAGMRTYRHQAIGVFTRRCSTGKTLSRWR